MMRSVGGQGLRLGLLPFFVAARPCDPNVLTSGLARMQTSKRGRRVPIDDFRRYVNQVVRNLERETDPVLRAYIASDLVEQCRSTAELFGQVRTDSMVELREQGWSLGDLALEFDLTRARVAQIACRDRYKSGESKGGGGRPKKS